MDIKYIIVLKNIFLAKNEDCIRKFSGKYDVMTLSQQILLSFNV